MRGDAADFSSMLMQTRDKYDNVRCLTGANDTLKVGVEYKDQIICSRDNATHNTIEQSGNTSCDASKAETEVWWKWQKYCVGGRATGGPGEGDRGYGKRFNGCYEVIFR